MRICMPRWCRPKMAGCSSRKRAVKRRQRPRARKYPWLRSGAWKGSKEAMIRPKSWGCTVLEASYSRMENEINCIFLNKTLDCMKRSFIHKTVILRQNKAKWPKTSKNVISTILFRIIKWITITLSTQRHKLQHSWMNSFQICCQRFSFNDSCEWVWKCGDHGLDFDTSS